MAAPARTIDEVVRPPSGIADVLVDGSVRLGGADVDELVSGLAAGLFTQGIRPGDLIAWQLPNWHEAVLLYRACWRLGVAAVPLHHLAGEREVAAMLDQVVPQMLFAGDGLPLAYREGTVMVRGDRDGFGDMIDEEVPPDASVTGASPDSRAVILFTSGSTGTPKGAVHLQRGLAHKAALMTEVHGLTDEDAILMPAPLAHISGLLNGVLLPAASGMKAVLMERWDPEQALELIETERITFMIGPPTFFVGLMGAPTFRPEAVASLRLVSSGGAGVTPAFVRQAAEAFACRVKRTYGSTEAPTVTTSPASDHEAERAATTDGRPTGDVELRVVDPATLAEQPAGAPGELWVRGSEVFVGYLDATQTAEAFVDGWFRTGDVGVVDEDGWLTIVGRLKDVIIRGGENIAPGEVEAVLEAHPDVQQAVAVGFPDERLGERVAAFVVASTLFDLATCRAWFRGQGVATFKTPERVIQLDALPVLAAGKPDRAALGRIASDVAD